MSFASDVLAAETLTRIAYSLNDRMSLEEHLGDAKQLCTGLLATC